MKKIQIFFSEIMTIKSKIVRYTTNPLKYKNCKN